jgi:hypothetical protein
MGGQMAAQDATLCMQRPSRMNLLPRIPGGLTSTTFIKNPDGGIFHASERYKRAHSMSATKID